MAHTIIQLALFIFFPIITLLLDRKLKLYSWLNPVVLCYGLGILLGNTTFFQVNEQLSAHLSEITVPFALILILISTNMAVSLQFAKKLLKPFLFGLIAVVMASSIAYMVFRNSYSLAAELSGMLIGVYTGGTPNLNAIAMSFNIDSSTLTLINSVDVVTGGIYLIILNSFAKPLLLKFLPAFKGEAAEGYSEEETIPLTRVNKITQGIQAVLISMVIATISFFIVSRTFGNVGSAELPYFILLITTLSIIVSFIPRINELEASYEIGYYLLLVFSIAIGSLADFSEILRQSPIVLGMFSVVLFLSISSQLLLSRLGKVDCDSFMIASTACIFGPLFVPQVAATINNRILVTPGILIGILGYAVGNYLGIGFIWLVKAYFQT